MIFVLSHFDKNILSSHFDKVLKFDCQFYNKEIFEPVEYFNLNPTVDLTNQSNAEAPPQVGGATTKKFTLMTSLVKIIPKVKTIEEKMDENNLFVFREIIPSDEKLTLNNCEKDIVSTKKISENNLEFVEMATNNLNNISILPNFESKVEDDTIYPHKLNKGQALVDNYIVNENNFLQNNNENSAISVEKTVHNHEFITQQSNKSQSDHLVKHNLSPRKILRRNNILKDKKHQLTIKDYQNLAMNEILKYDKRGFFKYIWDYLTDQHVIISLFFKKSLIEPIYIRTVFFCFALSMEFAINAILFSDAYIDKRALSPTIRDDFFYSLIFEFPKAISSMLMTRVLDFLVELIVRVPNAIEEEFNEAMITKDVNKIKEAK